MGGSSIGRAGSVPRASVQGLVVGSSPTLPAGEFSLSPIPGIWYQMWSTSIGLDTNRTLLTVGDF